MTLDDFRFEIHESFKKALRKIFDFLPTLIPRPGFSRAHWGVIFVCNIFRDIGDLSVKYEPNPKQKIFFEQKIVKK